MINMFMLVLFCQNKIIKAKATDDVKNTLIFHLDISMQMSIKRLSICFVPEGAQNAWNLQETHSTRLETIMFAEMKLETIMFA